MDQNHASTLTDEPYVSLNDGVPSASWSFILTWRDRTIYAKNHCNADPFFLVYFSGSILYLHRLNILSKLCEALFMPSVSSVPARLNVFSLCSFVLL